MYYFEMVIFGCVTQCFVGWLGAMKLHGVNKNINVWPKRYKSGVNNIKHKCKLSFPTATDVYS